MAMSNEGILVCDHCREAVEEFDELTCVKCLAAIKKHLNKRIAELEAEIKDCKQYHHGRGFPAENLWNEGEDLGKDGGGQ